MARNRSHDPDDGTDDYREDYDSDPGAPEADDVEQAFPKKKKGGSGVPWVLLLIVLILSGAAGYLAYTTLAMQRSTLETLRKQRDDAVAKADSLKAENSGNEAAVKKLEERVKTLEAEAKEKDAKLAQQSGASGDGASSDEGALVAPAKGGSKGKVTSAKASSKKSSHKKSRR